jgi:hypothetical protein
MTNEDEGQAKFEVKFEEKQFIAAMLNAYEAGLPWNFGDPVTQRVLARFRRFAGKEEA